MVVCFISVNNIRYKYFVTQHNWYDLLKTDHDTIASITKPQVCYEQWAPSLASRYWFYLSSPDGNTGTLCHKYEKSQVCSIIGYILYFSTYNNDCTAYGYQIICHDRPIHRHPGQPGVVCHFVNLRPSTCSVTYSMPAMVSQNEPQGDNIF
jgi:hypothetical protein